MFPVEVPNKSYGLQVALIVRGDGVELCACLGAGQAQEKDADRREANEAALGKLRRRLARVSPLERRRIGEQLTGWDLRRSWRQDPGTRDFETFESWLDYAASADGNGASISRNILRAELANQRIPLDEQLIALAEAAAPLFHAAYGDGTPVGATLDAIAERLFVPATLLRKADRLLGRKGQVIFYGPPGTGKTFIAQALAEFVTQGNDDAVEIVQFHPSYSYEDFVQGFRPCEVGGDVRHRLVDGPLLQIARRAEQNHGRSFVLLIDEINRGNLPRIFGELLYALEYRDQGVSLMYRNYEQEAPFRLPRNLFVIGTMNTADRSIAHIDTALRRRFGFVGLFPSDGPLAETLRRWFMARRSEMVWVANLLDLLNDELRDRWGTHMQVGPSHFMDPDLDEAMLEEIWEAQVMPLLEDQLFGEDEVLETLALDNLRVRLNGRSRATAGEGEFDADDPADRASLDG